ncbi:MAG TPA: hypothetical protein VFZ59_01515 [Verrucomicrobiae bacterium]|nr:hypothetical protein [Verrucomicrobiae bacterium]
MGELSAPSANRTTTSQWSRLIALMVTGLMSPMALLAAEIPAPQTTQSVSNRSHTVGWYFHSGQWIADVQTFKAACRFLVDDESDRVTPAKRK